jgi:hypothetical protein
MDVIPSHTGGTTARTSADRGVIQNPPIVNCAGCHERSFGSNDTGRACRGFRIPKQWFRKGRGEYLWKSERPSLHTHGGTMSRLIRASSASRSAKARRVLRAVRKSCIHTRLVDRELMAMRTNLSRHANWGSLGT